MNKQAKSGIRMYHATIPYCSISQGIIQATQKHNVRKSTPKVAEADLEVMDDAEQALVNYIHSKTLSPEFLQANGLIKVSLGLLEGQIRMRHSQAFGRMVRLAFKNFIHHDEIRESCDVHDFLDLPAESLYQFHECNVAAFEGFVTLCGCGQEGRGFIHDAVTGNFAHQIKESGLEDVSASMADDFRRCISYAGYLLDEHGKMRLSDEVIFEINRLYQISANDESDAVRKLAKFQYESVVDALSNVFDRRRELATPIVEKHINFCHPLPESLEAAYLCPDIYFNPDRANSNHIKLISREDYSDYRDAFSCLLEAEFERQCPDINLHLATSCFQDAAAKSLWRFRKAKGLHYGIVAARFSAYLGKVAATYTP